jgi:hypothetical protein
MHQKGGPIKRGRHAEQAFFRTAMALLQRAPKMSKIADTYAWCADITHMGDAGRGKD